MIEYTFTGEQITNTPASALFKVSPTEAVWVPISMLDKDNSVNVSTKFKWSVVKIGKRSKPVYYEGIELYEQFAEHRLIEVQEELTER